MGKTPKLPFTWCVAWMVSLQKVMETYPGCIGPMRMKKELA